MENNNTQANAQNNSSQFTKLRTWYQCNARTIRGIAALVGGLWALFYTRHTIFQFSIFLAGIVFVYYGLSLLRMNHITGIIDTLVGKVKE